MYAGHRSNSGIQNHSCGDIFPYTIRIRGNDVFGYCEAVAPDGEVLASHIFVNKSRVATFQQAHAEAEADARKALAGPDILPLPVTIKFLDYSQPNFGSASWYRQGGAHQAGEGLVRFPRLANTPVNNYGS